MIHVIPSVIFLIGDKNVKAESCNIMDHILFKIIVANINFTVL
jgi:hypothetical protein